MRMHFKAKSDFEGKLAERRIAVVGSCIVPLSVSNVHNLVCESNRH